jgi:hypothetical protein
MKENPCPTPGCQKRSHLMQEVAQPDVWIGEDHRRERVFNTCNGKKSALKQFLHRWSQSCITCHHESGTCLGLYALIIWPQGICHTERTSNSIPTMLREESWPKKYLMEQIPSQGKISSGITSRALFHSRRSQSSRGLCGLQKNS